jgi:predicted nucleotidyltransferase
MSETEPKPPRTGAGMPASILLDAFGQWLYEAFDETAYLVGSAAVGKEWRDIDVRLMLDDPEFFDTFPGYRKHHQQDAKWALMCAAISLLGKHMTGLPVDFQIQRAEQANRDFKGIREPLFIQRSPRTEDDGATG